MPCLAHAGGRSGNRADDLRSTSGSWPCDLTAGCRRGSGLDRVLAVVVGAGRKPFSPRQCAAVDARSGGECSEAT